MTLTRCLQLFLLCLAFVSTSAASQAEIARSAWAEEEQSSVRLIAARDGLGEDGKVRAGIQFRLKPGWKVYWRSPGDAGFPPQPDFSNSTNADVGPLRWPVPERFSVLGLETLGYKKEIVLPFDIRASDPGQDAKIALSVRYLTCAEICIPYDAELAMTLPTGDGAPTAFAHDIGKFESQVPRSSEAARLKIAASWTEASEKGLYIAARAASEIPFKNPDLYVEGPIGLGYGAPAVKIDNAAREAVLRVPVSGFTGTPQEAAEKLTGSNFVLTLLDGGRAAETSVSLGAPRPFEKDLASAQPEDSATQSFGTILLFAFLGGLILNLMPCVLPVLSLKFLSVVKHGGSAPAIVRLSFLASASGIIFAFLVLASALIALKSAGAGIGWGIQFQQPWFLIAMAFLVTLFACNMWGFFEFRLPGRIADAGHAAGKHDGIVGHFLQGAFATLLATPCSAPFLGTAVGFALSQGPSDIVAVFAVLGLGLAAPYLLIAAVPRLVTIMPKPGPWMARLKFVLGLALAATALWLLSVLAGAAGTFAAGLTGALLVGAAVWLGPVLRLVPEIKKATPVVLVLATIAAITTAEIGDINGPLDPETPGLTKIGWQKFDPAAIPQLIEKDLVVFVDVTADWCITCQVNKRLVLEQGRILELLNSPDVIVMQADWTRPDADIAAYLASFGRYGIPFNAVYGAGAPDGVALPELLSDESVMDGFRAAAPARLAEQFK
ncbi:MAG: thioredoxin family protein [Rhodospirillales bacterium]|nr:thioredoxin family protein [Rhodospirillales bacterium]MBO6785652.1 thioredoxin family protein [Rhodospirillales bacterium]